MECVICFTETSELYFRACCQHVLCQQCLEDILANGNQCLCQQQINLVNWESQPVLVREHGSKLIEQVHKADAWFWSTQHREFVDMPSWNDYLQACTKSLIDYVQFLNRVEAYQVYGKYPPVQPWTFELPAIMYYAQVYTHETYHQLAEEGMRQLQTSPYMLTDIFLTLKIQTPEICIEACKKDASILFYVKEPTYQLYNEVFPNDKNEAFRRASEVGHLDIVKCLLADGADDTDSALIYAAFSNHEDVVRFLIDHGANVHARNNKALQHAVIRGNLHIVEYLLDHGANMNGDPVPVLQLASLLGHLDIVKCLLARGGTSAEKDEALIRASIENHLDVVKYLLDHGANASASNNEAVKKAIENNHLELAYYLLTKILNR